MALLLSGEENQGPASDAYEVCVCKGWAEGRTVTAAGLEALKPYKVRNAVIMAAGFSSRFAPLSYECPKGLVKIKGEVLVERQIRQLQEAGILGKLFKTPSLRDGVLKSFPEEPRGNEERHAASQKAAWAEGEAPTKVQFF